MATTDFAKEGLFNILQNRIEFQDIEVLDLFGGTGSHSYEFISRGCKSVTYVDQHGPCIAFVKRMSVELKVEEFVHIIKEDVKKFVQSGRHSYDYIFAGPPYPLPWLDEIPDLIFTHNLLNQEGTFVLEHNPSHNFTKHPNFVESRNYGTTIFSFFKTLS